ncbi:MAG: nucleotidyltransferase domain-containing protein [Eubacteriales bacterium]|nr:nucleotidyltransferase domain-containing protein [Eubacteriales bacterium]
MTENLRELLLRYKTRCEDELNGVPVKVIVFGSYARGDFRADSDLDLMILAELPPEKLVGYTDPIYDLTYDFEEESGLEINPVIQSAQTYEYWKDVNPFFINIEREGVDV